MDNLTSHGCKSSAIRNHEVNLLRSFCKRKPVVAHGCLAAEEPTVNASQNDGTFSTWKTDDTVLMGDELTGSHKRGDMTALGASQLKIPNAHCAIAATNNGEKISVHGVHGAHCRSPAEWTQHLAVALWTTVAAIRLWPPDSKGIARKTGQDHPEPRSFARSISGLSAGKGSSRSAHRHHSHHTRPTRRLPTRIAGRCPDLLDGRHSFVGLARHELTGWLDRPGESARTAWSHEHRDLSNSPSPAAITAGQTHISHPATRPPPPLGLRDPGGLPGSGGLRRRTARSEG